MDLRARYQLAVNPKVVKLVGFAQFTEAIRPESIIRALANEPPVE